VFGLESEIFEEIQKQVGKLINDKIVETSVKIITKFGRKEMAISSRLSPNQQ